MKRKLIAASAALLLSATAQLVCAAGAIVGYNKVTVPANSDVLVTVPFTQPSAGTFTTTGKTGTGIVVGVTLTPDQFKNQFYVRMTSGNASGRWSTITGNDASTMNLADTSFLASINTGDTFEVIPHQTLDSVFPAKLKGVSFAASTSAFTHTFQVLFPNASAVGTNKSPSDTFYYFNNAWRKVGQPASANFGTTVISPQSYFILRNNTANALTYVTSGQVVNATNQARAVQTEAQNNDVQAATGNPLPVTLRDLRLGGSAAFKTTTSALSVQDTLLVFNNAATGQNKAPSATYYYFNNAWRKVGASASVSFDGEVLPAGAALIIRKVSGTVGSNVWSQPSPF